MYDLQVNRIYDNYECVRRKRKYKKYINKCNKELVDKYNYINSLYKSIFKNINTLIKINEFLLIRYRRYNINTYKYANNSYGFIPDFRIG